MTSVMLRCFCLRKPQPILKHATARCFRPLENGGILVGFRNQ